MLLVTTLVAMSGISLYGFYKVKNELAQGISLLDERIIYGISLVVIVLLMYFVLSYVCDKCSFIKKKIGVLLVLSMFATNIYMNWKYLYTNLTYADREIMIELGNMDIEDKYIVGQYMLGFTLYNDYVPVVNYYDSMEQTLLNNKQLYFFDYSTNWNPGMQGYIESIITDPNYHLVMEKEFVRETQTLGVVRNVALYRVERIQ